MADTRFKEGERRSPATEFKPGQHWRKPQVFREREWLQREYVEKTRSARDIAAEFGITPAAVFFWLNRHGIPRRKGSEARLLPYRRKGASGPENGMYGRVGEKNPNWKGGVTPERQAVYSSRAWANVVKSVWARDHGVCKRCGATPRKVHIHHIIGFAVESSRCDINNLVTLCVPCHRYVHSRENATNEFLGAE